MANASLFSKYNFGLLETPDSSDINSYSDVSLLSTSVGTNAQKTPDSSGWFYSAYNGNSCS